MMKEFKVKLDRKKLSKEHIESKQNFDSVLAQLKTIKAPFWKSAWFYGSMGLSGIAIVVGYSFLQNKEELNETIYTQLVEEVNSINENQVFDQPIVIAQVDEKEMEQREFEKKELPKKVKETVAVVKNDATPTAAKEVSSNDVVEQEVTKTAKKPQTIISAMPSIDGVYNGDISIDRFSSGEIAVGKDLKVKKFSIQYTSRNGDKTISVDGSTIPSEISGELKSVGLNQTVFITNVVAVNQDGDLMRCYSMDLNIKFK